MVEFALLLPLFFIVLFLIIAFGVGISRWVIVTHSTREEIGRASCRGRG